MNTERITGIRNLKTQAMAIMVIATLLLAALQVTPAHAASITSTAAGGDWNSPATWVGGVVPTSADAVTIASGATVTVTTNASAAALTFAATGDANKTVNINPGVTLVISGAVTIPRGLVSGVNTLAVGAGGLNARRISFTTATGSTGAHLVTISTGTVVVTGNILGSSGDTSPTISFSDAGILRVGGTIFTATNGTLTTFAGSTVDYDGNGTQTVGNFAYSNLTLSGSGAKTLPAAATISGNLTLSGTASTTTAFSKTIGGNLIVGAGTEFDTGSSNTATLTVAGATTIGGTLTLYNTANKTFTGDVTINSGGVWNEAGAAAISYGGSLQNDGSYIANTGLHTFSGSTKTIGGANPVAIPNLKITGTLTNNGTLTVSTALTGTGALVNGATGILNFGGPSIAPSLDATPAGNTVNYNGAAQTVSATTFDRLILQGSGAKSIAAGTAILGNLSIAPVGSAVASIAAGQTINVGTLTLGGLDQEYGTWGGVGSPASHINSTYFAATTGELNVGKATLTITANNLSKTYGNTLVFSGTEFTTSHLAGSDSVSSVTLTSTGAASAATVAGSPYPIVPSAAVGTGLDHYDIQYVAGSLAVTLAPLTVTGVTGVDKVYDGLTTASVNASAAVLHGLVGSDTATLNTGSATGVFLSPNVGLQNIQVSGLSISGGQSANYTLLQPTTSAHINPATLTVQAPSKAISASFVGEPTYTPHVSGFIGADTIAVVSGLSCNDFYDAAGTSPVPDPVNPTDPYPGGPGDFYIVCSGASATNYTFTYIVGLLHVSSSGAPNLVLPSVVNFGNQQIGTTSLVRTITLSNTGPVDLHLYGISVSNSQYQLLPAGSTCYNGAWPSIATPLTVPAGTGSCTVQVFFTPTVAGAVNGSVDIVSDNGTSPDSVPLAGSGYAGIQIMRDRSFEKDLNNDKIPDGWAAVGIWSAVDGRNCTVHYGATGKCSLKFVANGQLNVAKQALLQSGVAGDGLNFSLYSKASNVPTGATYAVKVLLFNGTTLVSSKAFSFTKGTTGWQLAQGTITAPAAFNKIVIQIVFKASKGAVWFDLGALTK